MNRRAIRVLMGILLALVLTGCGGGGAGANRPQTGAIGSGGGAGPITAPMERGQASQVTTVVQTVQAVTPPAIQRPELTAQRPELGQGQGQVSGALGQGVTVTVTEDQLNQALSQALSAAANPQIKAISVDLRAGVVGVSATVLVEGKEIATEVGLAPVVDACSLSLSVVEEPSQPSGIPAPLWNSVVDQVVTAIEAAVVTPQRACITAVAVSDGQMSVTVGRR
jgi:hypothetical protein